MSVAAVEVRGVDVSLLPPGATETGLSLPAGMSYDEWTCLGHALARMVKAAQWWIGDWLIYGEHQYGEKYAQSAAETGLSESTLQGYQWVADRIENLRRRKFLSFGHHREVAALPPSEADRWLDRAEKEDLSVHALREALRGGDSPSVHFSSATDQWATPQNLFDVLDAEFGFTLDVCATAENAKCAEFYTSDHDGLAQDWRGVCWMNPPYGDEIPAWVEKAYRSAEAGATVVCLVPARVDTGWWWDYCRFGEIRFLRGRLKFGDSESGAPFPSAVVVFPREPHVRWWEWRTA